MAAVYVSNLVINTGVDFSQVFTFEDGVSNSPVNLTGYDVSAQMMKHAGAASTNHYLSSGITTFTSSIYDATGGKIKIGLSTATTAQLKPGRYVYDVVTTDNSSPKIMETVVEGMVIVHRGVTRL